MGMHTSTPVADPGPAGAGPACQNGVMPSSAVAVHPLDVEIAGLVDGSAAPDDADRVEEHLSACLLCRIKRARLTGRRPAAMSVQVDTAALAAPAMPSAPGGGPGGEPRPGDIWVTSSPDRVMALVVAADDDITIVVPGRVGRRSSRRRMPGACRADRSPLGVPISIYRRLRATIQAESLRRKIGTAPAELLDGPHKRGESTPGRRSPARKTPGWRSANGWPTNSRRSRGLRVRAAKLL